MHFACDGWQKYCMHLKWFEEFIGIFEIGFAITSYICKPYTYTRVPIATAQNSNHEFVLAYFCTVCVHGGIWIESIKYTMNPDTFK